MPRKITPWLFIGPWLAGFLLLTVYPFACSFYWSFCEYDLLSSPRYVGTVHYQRLAEELIQGEKFGKAIWNTAYYALLSVPLSIALGVSLAVMLSWKIPARSLFRTLFFLPSVIPVAAAAILWMWMLDPQQGVVNYALSKIGLPTESFTWFKGIGQAAWPGDWFTATAGFGSKDALTLISLWGVGNFMVIYIAALENIPKSLYEAAELDGAGRFSRFRRITLPQLSPVIFFNLVMGLIQSVQAFTNVYLVSEGRGAPAESCLMLSLHLFLAAFRDLDMGYASAMAWILFVILLAATAGLFYSAKHWVYYRAG